MKCAEQQSLPLTAADKIVEGMTFMASSDQWFPGYLQGYFVVSMTGVYLKEDPSFEYAYTAGNILQAQSKGAVIQFFKIGLYNTGTIVVQAKIHIVAAVILSKVYKTGVTVFDDIVYQFLYDAEHQ